MSRTCGECTKCCEGYLHADLKFKDGTSAKMGPNPCPVLQIGKGCGDYENRPQSPCRGFQCEWLRQPDLYPDEMRPDKSLAIFSLQEIDKVPYLRITEAGARLDAEILSHAVKITLLNRFNIYWEVDGNIHWFGNKDFIQIMDKHKKESFK